MGDPFGLSISIVAGRYAISREIGRGGMATVYEADDTKHNRKVAIKFLRPDLSASLGSERFLREIGIAARLSHPHIVSMIDSGEVDGLLYYVAQYVSGGSLRDKLRDETRLTLAETLRIANQVGGALDFAHRNDVVHRDVKPENILFLDGHAMLTDFGIARACSTTRGSDSLTDAGIAVGTPEYMSPEQASGEQDLGNATDVYSLACVVYEMLAGEAPFTGRSARATIARHVTETPRPIRTLRPDVPPGVERALIVALAKAPEQRYATLKDFNLALNSDSAPESLPRAARTRAVAVLPFVNASPEPDNEYLSDGITDELIDALSKVRGLRIASRTSVFALKGKPQDVRAIGALLGVAEVLEGTVRKMGNRLRVAVQLTSTADGSLLWSQRYDRTLDDVFAIQDEIARTIVNTLRTTSFADLSEPLPRRYTENVKAYRLYLRGRFAWNRRTQEGVSDGIRYFEEAIEEDPNYAPAYAGLADSYALHVDYRSVPVREGFTRAKEYARKAIALDDTLAEAHTSLAWSLFIYDWDWDGAEREYRRALALDPTYATTHQWFATLLSARGAHDEALLEAHTAMELDPDSVSVRRTLGWHYFYARRYDQARYHLDRAITMNPTAEESYRILGLTLLQLGQPDDAERVLRESLGLPGSAAHAIATLGYVLGIVGKRTEAQECLARLEEMATHGYITPVAFSMLHLGLGAFDRALDYAEEAYHERRGWPLFFNVNPILDPLRGEPRFRELVRRVGLADIPA